MPNIVGIQFRDVGKVYYFEPNNIEFEINDGAIVETARGVEFGKVVIANKEVENEKIVGQLKPVIRKATEKDLETVQKHAAKKEEVISVCKEKIKKHKLDMKLVDAEYTFDGGKLVFYFTSDNRVDFRDLVKDLASVFRMRIELKQIGIRDECKMLGGLGPCGRVCCCNCYMGDFERVSIKMAKNQGLSLNPTKISGLCGRLMCCLKFENEYYADTIKFMPKINSETVTPDGKGTVQDIDILRQRVKVRIKLPNDEYEIKEYALNELHVKDRIAVDEEEPVDEELKSILD